MYKSNVILYTYNHVCMIVYFTVYYRDEFIYRKSIPKLLKLSDLEFIINNIIVLTLKTIFPDFVHIFAHYSAQTTFFLRHICTYNEKLNYTVESLVYK